MLQVSGTSIDSLMIWLLTLLNLKVAMFGHVKTTMEMSSQILLHRDSDL